MAPLGSAAADLRARLGQRIARDPAMFGIMVSSSHLVLNTLITGGMGYLYWIVAARLFTPVAVGETSALISAMFLVTHFANMGAGLGLAYVLPRAREQWASAVISLLTTVAAFAAAGSLVVFVAMLAAGIRLGGDNPVPLLVIFVLTATLWTLAFVFDQILIIERATSIGLLRNAASSAIRLLALPLTLLVVSTESVLALFGAWGVSALLTLVLAIYLLMRRGTIPRGRLRFDLGAVRRIMPLSLRNHLLMSSEVAPELILPLLVVGLISSEANAYFYTSWMVATLLFTIPDSMARSLFAHNAADAGIDRGLLRKVLLFTAMVVVPAGLVLALGRDLILMVFGPAYVANGSMLLMVLAFASIPMGLTTIYISVQQVRRNFARATVVSIVKLVAILGAAVLVIPPFGLVGLGVSVLVIVSGIAIVCAVDLWRTVPAHVAAVPAQEERPITGRPA